MERAVVPVQPECHRPSPSNGSSTQGSMILHSWCRPMSSSYFNPSFPLEGRSYVCVRTINSPSKLKFS